MAASDREVGQILEALKSGEQQRLELRQSLSESRTEIGKLREVIGAMRTELQNTAKRAEDAAILTARVSVIEARLGSIVDDVQAMQSFISLAKAYSIRTIIGVLIALAFGGSMISKVIDLFFGFLTPK